MQEWNFLAQPRRQRQTGRIHQHSVLGCKFLFMKRERGLQTDIPDTQALQPVGLIHQGDKQTPHLRTKMTWSGLERIDHLSTEAQKPHPACSTWTEASSPGDSVWDSEHQKQTHDSSTVPRATAPTQGPLLDEAGI